MNLKNVFKNNKVIAGISILAIGASAILASAFFTDVESKTVRATAGTVDIQLTDKSNLDSDGDGILNPGDTGTLAYTIENIGSKSIDAKTLIGITSDNILNQEDPEYTLSGEGITKEPTFSEDGKTINYEVDPVVINGTIETEPEANGTSSDQSFVFTFDIDSKNAFQDDNVVVNYTVYAKQHRNTEDSDWAELIDTVIGEPGDDEEIDIPETDGYEINSTNFPSSVIMADAVEFDVNEDGKISVDEKQESYTPSASVNDSFKGADKLSDKLVITNQENSLNVNEAADITEVIANDMGLNEVVVDDLTNLEVLEVKNNNLTEIYLSNNDKLTSLNITGNTGMTSLDLSNNTNIKDLSVGSDSNITEIKLPVSDSVNVNDLLKDFGDATWTDGENDVNEGTSANGQTITLKPDVQCIPIDEEHFPDEVFRQYVLDNIDTNKDNQLCDPERLAVETINNLSSKGISDLTGIGYFENLKELTCNGNNITELDLSNNKELINLNCYRNTNLSSLNILSCSKLTTLNCYDCNLTELDLSNKESLYSLTCNGNNIKDLDLSNCAELITLNCYENNITELDVSKNTKLKNLNCHGNELVELDIKENTLLETLSCSNCNLIELDVSNNPNITNLTCGNNQIKELDLSNLENLTNLNCLSDSLNTITLPNNENTLWINQILRNKSEWQSTNPDDFHGSYISKIPAVGQTLTKIS